MIFLSDNKQKIMEFTKCSLTPVVMQSEPYFGGFICTSLS